MSKLVYLGPVLMTKQPVRAAIQMDGGILYYHIKANVRKYVRRVRQCRPPSRRLGTITKRGIIYEP